MRKVGPAKVYTLSTRLPAEQILSQSSDPILILDESYTIREVSDSFLLAFGCSKDDLNNHNLNTTSIGPGLIDRIRDPVKQGMAGKESVVNAWVPVQKEWKAFRIRIIPLVFGWGDKGVVVMLEDQTGEKMAQEENTLLADLLNASPAAITVVDLQGNFLYSNQKNLDLHGYSQNEFLNLNLSHLNIPESAKRIAERMMELRNTGESSFEVVHFRKDGRQIPLEVHAKLARWGDRDVIISIATDISERKRAERALRESERRFADIIDFLPDATYVVNSEGIVIAWNRAIEEMTGVPAADMIGKGDYEYALPFYGERRPILLDLIFRDDPDVRMQYRRIRKEGSTFTAETVLNILGAGERILWLKASPFYDKDGRITGAIESIRDITEHRKAEETLIKSKERFNQVAENSGEWIWEVDAEGVYTYCSSAAEKILGYSTDELVGRKHYYDLFAPDVRAALTESTLAAIRRKDTFRNFVNPNIHKNGSTVILETSGSAVLDEQGTLLGYRGVDLDITERTDAENALKESEAKFRALVENSLDGILITDFTGTLLFANRAAGRIVDSVDSQTNPPVRNVLEFVAPESRADVLRDFIQVAQGIDAYLVHYKLITEMKREIWVECIGKKILFGGSPAMLVSMRDVTERKRSEAELRESENKFATVFKSNPVSLTLVSATDGVFVDVNDAFVKGTGYTREDVIGKTSQELGIIVDNTAYEQVVSLLRDQRQVQGVELRCRIKTGEIRTCRFSSRVIMMGGKPHILSTVEDVTERKQAEEALRESEELFREVFDSANDGITLVERTPEGPGRFILVNNQAARMLGYLKEEILQMTPRDIVPPDIRKNVIPDVLKKLITDGHATFESVHKRKDGSIYPIEISLHMFRYKGMDIDLSIYRDITERKQAESAFQAMVTSMVGTTGMDSLDRITESISIWLGADCIMIGEITPDRERVQVLSMLLDGKKIPDYSYNLKGTPCENSAEKGFCMYPDEVCKRFPKSMDLRKFNIRGYVGTPLRNFEGQVVGVLCIMTRNPLNLPASSREIIDIIAVKAAAEIGRRKALEALHESERKFRTIFENSPYPIAINSYPDCKFLEVNAVFLKVSGYTEREILGKTPVELGLLSHIDSAMLVARMLMTGTLENVPLTLTGKGGRRVYVLFSCIPATINDRPAVVTVTAEITKLKRVEEELLQKNEELEASEERLSLVMNGVPTLIAYMDTEMRFVYINKSHAEWYGRAEEELIGKCLIELLPEDVFLRVMPYYQKALGGQEVVFENPMRDSEGRERVLLVHLVPHIRNEHVVGIFAALNDVTGRR